MKVPLPVHISITLVLEQVSVPPVAEAPGGVAFCVIRMLAEFVHPLAGSVTISVYVPGALTIISSVVAIGPPGPLQLKDVPPVVDPPFRMKEVVEQVSSPPPVAIIFGTAVFEVTITSSVAVQVVCGSVTVSEYVPEASTSVVAVFAPLTMFPPLLAVQAKLTPALPEPFKLICGPLAQVITRSEPASTVGDPVSPTNASKSTVHSFASVTVTVYGPLDTPLIILLVALLLQRYE